MLKCTKVIYYFDIFSNRNFKGGHVSTLTCSPLCSPSYSLFFPAETLHLKGIKLNSDNQQSQKH